MEKILDMITSPAQLKRLSDEQLERLAAELREEILQTVSANGGHLASSLGAIELTLALFSIFNLPTDKIVWDVGHQAYAHKILTGRRERFNTLRQLNGITGFPNRAESPYDAFGVGHASTSISAALGMAIARDLNGRGDHVIAVIGDGALTGGEAYEGLNHAGDLGKNLIVVLNDNGMSIDSNVGAMSEYLSRMRLTPQYNKAKKDIEGLLRSIPHIGDTVLKTAGYIKDGVRSVLVPGGLFEEMGFNYVGPLDGHNLKLLREVFSEIKLMDGPILVHVRTKKGKGYLPAEIEPDKFHGIGKFDLATGRVKAKNDAPPSYTKVFSDALIDIASEDSSITAITAAMPSGTGLKAFAKVFPDRYFDVGIAEEHAVTLAAGMAAEGKHPVVALYSTFAQRAYDQLMHDVCLQNLPVIMCLDRGGLVGEDGATHHGVFDLSYMRQMPGMIVMVPKDENELRQMLFTASKQKAPVALRYPRGSGLGVKIDEEFTEIPIGKGEVIIPDGEIVFMAVGTMVEQARQAIELLQQDGISASLLNMRYVKPLDEDLIKEYAAKSNLIVTLEENALSGGFGSAVCELLADEAIIKPVLRLGIADNFVTQGARQELLEICGLLPAQIAVQAKARLNGVNNS